MRSKFDICLEALCKEAVSHQWLRKAIREAKLPEDVGEAQTRLLKAYQTYGKPIVGQSAETITGTAANMKRFTAGKAAEKRLTKSTSEHGWLGKVGSAVTRASGLKRVGQLLTGSRARALEERAQGVDEAGRRAFRMLNSTEMTHAPQGIWERMTSNSLAAQRAGRAAGVERSGVSGARGLSAGVLGAGIVGGASMLGGDKPTAVDPGAEPPKKSPLIAGAKVLGTSLAGFGLGQLAGAGIGKGIEAITRHKGGDPAEIARKVAPLVGTAAGIIYPIWRGREQKGISDAVQSARDQNERRLPGQ